MLNIWILSGCAAAIVGNSGVVVYDLLQDYNETCIVEDFGNDINTKDEIIFQTNVIKTSIGGEDTLDIHLFDENAMINIRGNAEGIVEEVDFDGVIVDNAIFNIRNNFDSVSGEEVEMNIDVNQEILIQEDVGSNYSNINLDRLNDDMLNYEYHLSNAAAARLNWEIAKNQIAENEKALNKNKENLEILSSEIVRLRGLFKMKENQNYDLIDFISEKEAMFYNQNNDFGWMEQNYQTWKEEQDKWFDLMNEEERLASIIINQISTSI